VIVSPSRSAPIVTRLGEQTDRYSAWTEQVSRALNSASLIAYSQIVDVSRGTCSLNYSGGVLTQVIYSDLSTKTFNYSNGVLQTIVDSAGNSIEFIYNNGELVSIGVV
jgi:hypothetical protein